MFKIQRRDTAATRAFTLAELIFHATVRHIRKGHGNGVTALLMNILQTVIFVGAFVFMFSVLGLRGSAIRGDFVLYIMSGIFLFMTNIKAMGAIVGAEGPASPMMKHAPMNTAISISAAALSCLYLQTLSVSIVLFGVHVAWHPIVVEDWSGAAMMFLLAWFVGVAMGMVLLAIKPWAPNFVQIAHMMYSRVNMIASGKMFVANALPAKVLAFFDWNPLFHIIDQARGYTFINYNPHYTNWEYPLTVAMIFLVIGMMGEFYTRRHASVSWFAGR
ncbi:ABC transporter permease [Jannaschia rubra]|uniref:Vi polysaccharide export inner membrane protein VexB n=1 Tax=Jannaschia rubra TaxID=282197 RepID=A0A0M6XQ16_9RHOB|nr:ABC transporter permease [Jannaschia rubra]CTQ32762.1 Vi polysaccharide export inner membrane protein VexB [Jannaschia rubra]SFF89056.1 ABC-type polysaccharide/polyol phosphate export permease [Jannaschia rubra]